jgi:hypothetical protein
VYQTLLIDQVSSQVELRRNIFLQNLGFNGGAILLEASSTIIIIFWSFALATLVLIVAVVDHPSN